MNLSNYGENSSQSGTNQAAYTLPIPSLNDDGQHAAYDYLVECGEIQPGEAPESPEYLQELVYRLTVELARSRSLLRLERLFTEDCLDEIEEFKERMEFLSMASGVDEDSITELMCRVEIAEEMAAAALSSVNWDALLDGE